MVDGNTFDAIVERQLRKARAAGIHPPVVAMLSSAAGPARAAFADRHGGRLKPRGKDWVRGVGRIVTWSMADAIRLLRRHAGLGGNLVANLLDDLSQTVDTWSLDWGQALSVSGFRGEDLVVTSCTLYDDLPFAVCERCARVHGAVDIHVPVAGGAGAAVAGASVDAAARAAALLRIVGAGAMPAVDYPVPETMDLPVRDDELAHILRVFYGDAPGPVIDVLAALRQTDPVGHRWLVRVLEGRPELAGLAGRVRAAATRPDGRSVDSEAGDSWA
jgi:hypothetical protein